MAGHPRQELRVGLADLREYFPLATGQTYFVTAQLTVTRSDKSGVVHLISNTLNVNLAAGRRDADLSLGEVSPGGGVIDDGAQLLIDTSKHRFNPDEPVDLTLHLKNLRATTMGVRMVWRTMVLVRQQRYREGGR